MLTNILWQETSGVDHPANLEEGWLVMKTVENEMDVILKTAKAHIEKQDKLMSLLQGTDFKDAPDNVKASVTVLMDWLKEEGYGELETKQGKPEDYGCEMPTKKGLIQALQEAIRSVFSHKVKKYATTEEALTACWPSFQAEVDAILKSSDDKVVKKQKADQAVDNLAKLVGESLIKEGTQK